MNWQPDARYFTVKSTDFLQCILSEATKFISILTMFSGDKKRKANPSQYRDPTLYNAMFSMLTVPTENPNEVYGFELVLSRPVNSYIKV